MSNNKEIVEHLKAVERSLEVLKDAIIAVVSVYIGLKFAKVI